MYKALYRKYRPVTFDDVTGQNHITDTLKNQILTNRLSHAYLFVGTRGTGKTTCAKILSKAVNCEHPVGGNPCNKCPSCVGINNGSVLDVVELDAASNNGVENIRALRDEAVYTPSEVKKRVYIVDEVHMLSTAAFNALLKILEEPPEHLIFILATTELHKVPATILSRCQRFSFKRITAEDISRRLDYVASCENIELTHDASALLSRLADGSMRDALSLLDQCRSSQRIDEAHVMSCIGLAGAVETAKLLDCIETGSSADALNILDKLYMSGKDPGGVLSELSSMIRDIMVMRMAPDDCEALLSGSFSVSALKSCKIPTGKLLWCAKTLQNALAELDSSPNRRTSAEYCLIQLTSNELFTDTDALLARISTLEAKLAGGVTVSPAPPKPEVQKKPETAEKPKPVEASVPQEEKSIEPPQKSSDTDLNAKWKELLAELDPAKSRLLSGHNPQMINGKITVNVGPGFVYSLLNKPDNLKILEAAATKAFGKPTSVIITDKSSESGGSQDKLNELRRFDNIKFY